MSKEIRTRHILRAVLLQTLKQFPNGVPIRTVYDEIKQNFTFPDEWMREIPKTDDYKKLGLDWKDIPQQQLVQMVQTEPQWENEIRWARNDLRKLNYLDASAPRGIWKLSQKGQKAIDTSLAQLTVPERQIATPRPKPKTPQPDRRSETIAEPKISARETLQKTLLLLTSSIPLSDLELLVDIARTIRLRSIEK